jgi:hypothetical protein
MKICPTCKYTFKDEELNFCPADGTTLLKIRNRKNPNTPEWLKPGQRSQQEVKPDPRLLPEAPQAVKPRANFLKLAAAVVAAILLIAFFSTSASSLFLRGIQRSAIAVGFISYIWIVVLASWSYTAAYKIATQGEGKQSLALAGWLFVLVRPLIFCGEMWNQPSNMVDRESMYGISATVNLVVAVLFTWGYYWIRRSSVAFELKEAERLRLVSKAEAEAEEAAQVAKEVRARNSRKALLSEFDHFLQSDESRYLEQFAAKYGKYYDTNALQKLKLVISDKWDFSVKNLEELLELKLWSMRADVMERRLSDPPPVTLEEAIATFLNHYDPDDDEAKEMLFSLVYRRGLFTGDMDHLGIEISAVNRRLEKERFKQQLEHESSVALSDIEAQSGYEFESFLKDLFSRMGYKVEQTKLSGDQGADLIVVKSGETAIIQAKRFAAPVGNKAVQEIVAAVSLYRADKGMVITNNRFTPAAYELAQANGIDLVDGQGLMKLVQNYW